MGALPFASSQHVCQGLNIWSPCCTFQTGKVGVWGSPSSQIFLELATEKASRVGGKG